MAHTVYKNREGKRLPSVTTVIKQLGWSTSMLMAWQARMFRSGKDPDQIKDEACDIGNVTHGMIESWIFGQDEYEKPEGVDDLVVLEASDGLRDFVKWSEDNGVEYLESEIRLISEEYQYAGTADAIIRMGGKTYLLDFKTSKGIYDSYPIQLAAYKSAIEETTGYRIDGCMIVKIAKGEIEKGKSRVSVYDIPEEIIEEGWDAFEMCLNLKKVQSAIGKCIRRLIKEKGE